MKLRRTLSLFLCAALLFSLMPLSVLAAPLGNFDTDGDYAGLNLSVIGDSITTYFGVSNTRPYNPLFLSTSEATFGTYYGNTSHGDYSEMSEVKRLDTWWQQTADTLGMNLLVNNAWSGSLVLTDTGQSNTTEYGVASYKARCVNLHNGSEKPNIIAVYMGTNDIAYYQEIDVGTQADIDTASERSSLYTSVNNYKTPTSSVEAYFIMISRMVDTYPDAEIYCMLPTYCMNTMSTGRRNALENFNGGVRYIVDHFAASNKNVYLVDLNADSGFVDIAAYRNQFYCNNVHPSKMGMDVITSCLVSEIMEHSAKGRGTSATYPISYNLNRSYATTGLVRYGVEGKSFSMTLAALDGSASVPVTVTMADAATGKQTVITGSNSIYIPEVTGPITVSDSGTVSAKTDSAYHWSVTNEGLISQYGTNLSFNAPTLLSGTCTGGTMDAAQYSLEKTVVLDHTKPWELEFRGGGSTYAGGILLTSKTADSPADGNTYIHFTQTNVFFGYRNSVGYNNSGISWVDIAAKMGSGEGTNYRTGTHTYRFKNVPNGENNKIWLYVDGVQIGTMDSSKMVGGSATHEKVGEINLSGKDFQFNYLGSVSHPLQNFTMGHLKVWENGEANAASLPTNQNYRWELSGGQSAFVSVEDDADFTANELSLLSGSITGGSFSGTTFAFETPVVLMHDRPWSITWESQGSWQDNRGGGMMLATTLDYKALWAPYIYRRPDSGFIAFGAWNGSTHENYGIMLSDYGIDGAAKHTYSLVNEISGSSNMVYLYVDGVKLGALNQKYLATDYDSTSNWISGKDFVFSYIGTNEFSVGGCVIPYMEIGNPCDHSFGSWITDSPATCTEAGSRSRSCSACGKKEAETVPAAGHTMTTSTVDANCQDGAHSLLTCTVCGHSEKEYASYSDWSETQPSGIPADQIRTKVQYRYADRQTLTSYNATESGYTQIGSQWDGGTRGSVSYVDHWPSGFLTSNSLYKTYSSAPKTPYETDSEKLVVNSNTLGGYLYYHWCYSGMVNSMPSKTGSYTNFHAYYSTTCPDDYKLDTADTSYRTANTAVCTNSNWYFVADVNIQNYTVYRKLYTHETYGSWSSWSDTAVSETGDRKVETRILYAYSTAPLGDHKIENGQCTVCGLVTHTHDYSSVVTPATCTEDGYTTYTCSCGDSYVSDHVAAAGHSYDSVVTAPTCTKGGYTTYTCSVCSNSYVDDHVPAVQHTYSETVTHPTCTEDGYTTYTCTACGYSYRGDETLANGHNHTPVVTPPTCTEKGYTTYTCACGDCYIANEVSAIGHNYVDGICSNCGGEDPNYVLTPTGKVEPKSATLSLEDEVLINLYFIVEEMEATPDSVGMLIYNEKPETADVATADTVIEGGLYNASNGRYMVSTPGIPGQYLADSLYLVAYAKDANGNYVYARTVEYSGKKYCTSQMTKGTEELKATCVALMNYGAAAQQYFAATSDYTYDALMNEEFAQYQDLVVDYSDDLLAARQNVDAAKAGSLGTDKNGFDKRSVSMSADGDFSLNYYFTTDKAVDKVTFYYWTADQYNSVDTLTLENASGSKEMVLTDGTNRYWANFAGIAAKDIDKTIFACGVYEVDGVTYSTGVFSYSIGYYCTSKAAGTDETVKPFAKAIAVYSYHARIFLETLN